MLMANTMTSPTAICVWRWGMAIKSVASTIPPRVPSTRSRLRTRVVKKSGFNTNRAVSGT